MLIDGINKNRYRIESIFRRLDEEEDDELSILKGLVREGLLSDKQFEKLVELDVSDLPAVALVIKDTKVGQGVKFLPDTMKSLRESLRTLSKELIDTGSANIKTQLIPVLEELFYYYLCIFVQGRWQPTQSQWIQIYSVDWGDVYDTHNIEHRTEPISH